MAQKPRSQPGRYLYCIVDSSARKDFGEIGVDGNLVYSIPYQDISAVVHDCQANPYDSDEEEEVKSWVRSHQKVLEAVMEDPKYNSLLPAGFDTIIQPEGEQDASTTVKGWLNTEYSSITEQLDKVRGKEEYGVHVTYDPDWLAETIPRDSEKIQSIREKIESKPEGAAYLYREKLEKLLSGRMEEEKQELKNSFIDKIRPSVDRLVEEEEKDFPGEYETMMSIACLVDEGEYQELGDTLEEIDDREGLSVRFTGPWAPYSFTSVKEGDGD